MRWEYIVRGSRMPFPEPIKDEVRRKAGYRGCMCEKTEVLEVHPIAPEIEGGPDDLDNAVRASLMYKN
jgi:hypothetical protein